MRNDTFFAAGTVAGTGMHKLPCAEGVRSGRSAAVEKKYIVINDLR